MFVLLLFIIECAGLSLKQVKVNKLRNNYYNDNFNITKNSLKKDQGHYKMIMEEPSLL